MNQQQISDHNSTSATSWAYNVTSECLYNNHVLKRLNLVFLFHVLTVYNLYGMYTVSQKNNDIFRS